MPETLPRRQDGAGAPSTAAAGTAISTARVVNPTRIAFLGDSIPGLNGTGDNVATNHNYFNNISNLLPTMLKGRGRFAGVYNTGGSTLAQIRDTVLPRLLAKPPTELPGTVVLMGGTNDVGGLIATAVSMQAVADIHAALAAKGIRLTLCTIPPRNDSQSAAVGTLNASLTAYAEQYDLDCLPHYAALVNPANGQYATGMHIGDGIHPSPAGMVAMAQADIAAGFGSRLPVRPAPTAKAANDVTNLAGAAGLFLTDSNSDGVADVWGFSNNIPVTRSLVTPAAGDGLAGNWQRYTVAAGTAGGFGYLQLTGSASAGDLLEFAARVRITGATGGGFAANSGVSVQIIPTGGTISDATTWVSGVDIDGTVVLSQRLAAGHTGWKVSINTTVPSTGTLTVDVGEVTVRNRTALGLG